MRHQVHLIFVDDDRDDRLLFKEAVEAVDPSKTVTLFDDGFQLLRILNNFIPDVIFLDMNMPGMSGFACLEEIRKNPAWDDIAVIIYSTSGDIQTIEKAYKAGANLYIKKPDNFNAIKESIRKCFDIDFETIFPQPERDRFLVDN